VGMVKSSVLVESSARVFARSDSVSEERSRSASLVTPEEMRWRVVARPIPDAAPSHRYEIQTSLSSDIHEE
jgi:hypothetical protein